MTGAPKKRIRILLVFLAILGIGLLWYRATLNSEPTQAQLSAPHTPITSISPDEADVRILMFGNSHTSMHSLPVLLATMLEEATPDKRYYIDRSRNMDYLVGKWKSTEVQDLFESQPWDVIVLQAQKYSTTGRYEYPTDGAENWIQAAHERKVRPILYPEWGQRGNIDEGRRVHALHHSIADKSNAEVAPVGMAWEMCLEQMPELELFAPDGNHASSAGAYLTACVLVSTITQQSPTGLYAPSHLDKQQVTKMQEIAWAAYNQFPPTS